MCSCRFRLAFFCKFRFLPENWQKLNSDWDEIKWNGTSFSGSLREGRFFYIKVSLKQNECQIYIASLLQEKNLFLQE